MSKDEDIKRSKGEFDLIAETREWSASTDEDRCKKLAKRKGKRLVEIIDTENGDLPIICIFEDYPE